jgi:hydroxyacylglutathione hydrolase
VDVDTGVQLLDARVGHVYLVDAGDGPVLVDTGMRGSERRVLRSLERAGRRPSDIRTIVLTHCDLDHLGSVAALARLTGAAVAIHELDAPVLAGTAPPQKGGRVMAALFRLTGFRPVTPDVLLRDGDVVGGLRVLHVPGHTPGSVALVRDDGVVCSGDALLGDRHGGIRPPDPRLAWDPAQAVASGERVRAACTRLLLPGHGRPVRLAPTPDAAAPDPAGTDPGTPAPSTD